MTGFKSKRAAAQDKLAQTAQGPTLQKQLDKAGEGWDKAKADYSNFYADWDKAEADRRKAQPAQNHVEDNLNMAQPAQEPVAWMGYEGGYKIFTRQRQIADAYPKLYTVALYPHPHPQRPWVDLTEDQIEVIEAIALTKQWAIRMTIEQLKECNA